MKTNFIVKADAHGFNNGKEYHGLVIATKGKEKAISYAYLPDVFNEVVGKTLAELKLKRKLSRRKEVRILSDIKDYENVMLCCSRILDKLCDKAVKEYNNQNAITSKIMELAD